MAEDKQQVSIGLLEVILQELVRSRRTGVVTVQRSKAGVRDIGTITLILGEVVEAHAGDRLGLDAVQWLYTWGRCQCEFRPQAATEVVISPPPPIPDVIDPPGSPRGFFSRLRKGKNQTASEPMVIQDLPSPKPAYNQAKNRETGERDISREITLPNSAFDLYSQYNQGQIVQETPIPSSLMRETPSLQAQQNDSDMAFSEWLRNGSRPQPQSQAPLNLIDSNAAFAEWLRNGNLPQPKPKPKAQTPYRLWHGQDALMFLDKAKVSRLHRHVFLLLDGQRTIDDLTRITGQPFAEVKRLLDDLEQIGIIKQD